MKRALLPAVVGAVALFAGAAPAHAGTIVYREFKGDAATVLTSCSKTATIGSSCIVLVIDAHIETSTGHPDLMSFEVDAGRSILGPNWDISSSFDRQSGGLATVGSMSSSGSTGKLSVSVNIVCESAPCELSGLFKIKVSMTRAPGSKFTSESSTLSVKAGKNCSGTVTETEGLHLSPAGTGSLRFGGSTKAMKVWQPYQSSGWAIDQAKSTEKVNGTCLPSPVVLADAGIVIEPPFDFEMPHLGGAEA